MPLYDILEFGELLDSADMDVGDWVTIAQMIEENYFAYDGFLVITGTDTMVRARRKSDSARERGAREERAPQESCARALRVFICFYHVVLLLLLALVIRTHSFFFIIFFGYRGGGGGGGGGANGTYIIILSRLRLTLRPRSASCLKTWPSR